MAELNTLSYPDFVALGEIIFEMGKIASVDNRMASSGLVAEMQISKNTGNTRMFSEADTNEYLSRKNEGDQASRAKFVQGYKKLMTKYRFGENFSITYEMLNENKYDEVWNALYQAGGKGVKTMDLDLSHRLTFGTATSYTDRDGETVDTTCGDGYQLFYTAHTLKGSSTTFRNRLANNPKVSKGALEAMERMIIENTYSHLGEKKTLDYDIIWTTDDPNTINTVREYLQSSADVESSNAGTWNPYRSKYRHVVLPRVATDANGNVDTSKRYYWGLAASSAKAIKLGVWESPHFMAASINTNSEDVMTDDLEFRNRAGYGICTPGAIGITISSGDGAA